MVFLFRLAFIRNDPSSICVSLFGVNQVRLATSFDKPKFRDKDIKEFSYLKLYIIPVIVTTIHMGYQSVLFYPTEEKLKQAKTIFHNVFVENGIDHFSTGFVGNIVNPFLLILT